MPAKQKRKFAFPTRTLVFTALLTALVVAATVVLGFRTGDFFFNCGDTVIFVTAALLGPVPAMLAGGIGSFFADLAVYPATMFFTLVIKGLEGLLCGLLMKLFRTSRRGKFLAPVTGGVSMLVAGVFMMTGYFICNSFIYGTPASALAARGVGVCASLHHAAGQPARPLPPLGRKTPLRAALLPSAQTVTFFLWGNYSPTPPYYSGTSRNDCCVG